jgi:hypothetical protein
MIKLINLLKEIKILVPGTRVYVSDPYVELYKIENFPALSDAYDIDFASEEAEEAKKHPEMVKLLQNPQFRMIMDKIQKEDESKQQSDPIYFQAIYFDGDFNTTNSTAYVYISGDSSLTFTNDLDVFGDGYKTEEDWGVQSWKKL